MKKQRYLFSNQNFKNFLNQVKLIIPPNKFKVINFTFNNHQRKYNQENQFKEIRINFNNKITGSKQN